MFVSSNVFLNILNVKYSIPAFIIAENILSTITSLPKINKNIEFIIGKNGVVIMLISLYGISPLNNARAVL